MDSDHFEEQKVPAAFLMGINFDISTDKDHENLSVMMIESPGEVMDPKLGFPNRTNRCFTCGAENLHTCEGHIGLIKFQYSILQPYFLSEVVKILNKICPRCKSVKKDLWIKGANSVCREPQPKGCKYCAGNAIGSYPKMKFKVTSKEFFRKSTIMVEVSENSLTKIRKRGMQASPADYWGFLPLDEQQEENSLNPTKRVLSHAQVLSLLKDVPQDFVKKFVPKIDSLFISCFPVTPNCHRVKEVTHRFSNGQRLIFDNRTRMYKKMVDFRGIANELSSCVLECLRSSKLYSDKSSGDDSFNAPKQNKDFGSKMSGLRFMKDIILGKRTDHCFRMVIIGNPNLKLCEIGLPCHIAEKLQIAELLNAWNWEKLIAWCDLRILEWREIYIRREESLVCITNVNQLQIGDTIFRPVSDGDVLLINRPPSIHQHSIIALSVKVLPVISVLSINPLICSPFSADFDGDCIHGYVPQSLSNRVELNELVALNRQLINAQNGRNLLSLTQDSLTAAYLIKEDGVFLNLFQMQQLGMFCPHGLPLPAIIKAPSLKNSVWTGKQLLGMLFPPGFDYIFPPDDVNISNGELISSSEGSSSWLRDGDGNIFQSLIRHHQGMVLDILYSSQEVFCEWLSMRGFSVSLLDLYLSIDSGSQKNMIDEISCGLQEAEEACNFEQLMVDSYCDFLVGNDDKDHHFKAFDVEQLCYEKQRSIALSQANVDAFKQVFRDIQNLAYKYANEENSFLIMSKSGSKGNLLKLVQHSICLGLQHSLVPLSFRFPHQLSCAAWNSKKSHVGALKSNGTVESATKYIPYAVVENSFLTGLNPLECFVHSVTSRDSSFSDNADLPGTLSRKIMFFMRDLYTSYDGTVRDACGNQVVQFSYNVDKDRSSSLISTGDIVCDGTSMLDGIGGQPVGLLSACAISEAAYSALDQPISLFETSPLLNLKRVLECGSRKSKAEQTMSLFLSEKLGRSRHGFEYGALQVKNHLERLVFSDIVSTVSILFSPQSSCETHFSPWVCHFHICKETAKRRELKLHSIIDSLHTRCNAAKVELKIKFPKLQITSKDCSLFDMPDEDDMFCVTLIAVENSKSSSIQLDLIQEIMIPFLLDTVIKGFQDIKKVAILWNDQPKASKSYKRSNGEFYLRVSMSGDFGIRSLWSVLMDDCLQIMDKIDWRRSHPDNISQFCSAYGINAGWKFFLNNLESAVSDIGKTILPEHLCLVANCLSATGEFVGLNPKGLARQREHASVSSPFTQACFSNPSSCFVKAAKAGARDNLQGTLDALAWGKVPPIGTSGQFDIVYSFGKDDKPKEPVDVYNMLGQNISSQKQNLKLETRDPLRLRSEKCGSPFMHAYGGYDFKGLKDIGKISRSFLKSFLTLNDILKLSTAIKNILHRYPINQSLNDTDRSILMMALCFHPRRDEKIGSGAKEIKVTYHQEHKGARCFSLVRTDGTTEDFSYHKCVHGALEIIAPKRAKSYESKWLHSSIV